MEVGDQGGGHRGDLSLSGIFQLFIIKTSQRRAKLNCTVNIRLLRTRVILAREAMGLAEPAGPTGHLQGVAADGPVSQPGAKTAGQVCPITPDSESPLLLKGPYVMDTLPVSWDLTFIKMS